LLTSAWVFGEPIANDGLGGATGLGFGGHGVHLGGVDEVHTTRQRAIEDGVGIGFVHLFTKSHGAQANGGHAQVAGAKLYERESHGNNSNKGGFSKANKSKA
jgi:hypothetical protein